MVEIEEKRIIRLELELAQLEKDLTTLKGQHSETRNQLQTISRKISQVQGTVSGGVAVFIAGEFSLFEVIKLAFI